MSGLPQPSAQANTSALRPIPIAMSFFIGRIVYSSTEGKIRAHEHVHLHGQTWRAEAKGTPRAVTAKGCKKHNAVTGNNYASVKKGCSGISSRQSSGAWQSPTSAHRFPALLLRKSHETQACVALHAL
jgi:hypothetical protein